MMKKSKFFVCVIAMTLALCTLASCGTLKTPDADGTENTTIAQDRTPNTMEDTTMESTTHQAMTSESTPIETTTDTQSTSTSANAYRPLNYDDFKAMWLSQFDLSSVYTNGSAQRSEASYTKLIKTILGNVHDMGFNTVIVQVRPNADSMYPSEFYPMSTYVVGAYGKEADYDPFEILIAEAHELGLSVQAWINPLRGMLDSEIVKIDDRFPIKTWYNDKSTKGQYIVLNSNRWYLNPAYDEARQLIIDGAREILEKYDVDGLHMDDYFYPTQDSSFDAKAYTAYVKDGGKLKLDDWRRDLLNKLVSGLWQMTKEYDKDVIFGISPAGNYETVYNKQYADVYTWCANEGYIDYICPQAYFGMEHQTWSFSKVVNGFSAMIKTDKVKLYVGMTLGKALNGYKGVEDQYAGSGKREWIEKKDILMRELEYTKNVAHCQGVAYFCYQYFYNPTSGAAVKETATERAGFLPVLKDISWQ